MRQKDTGSDTGLHVFLLAAFSLSIAVSAVARLTGAAKSPYVFILGVVVMIAPFGCSLIAWKLSRRPFGNLGFGKFPIRYLLLALFLVPVASWVAGAIGIVITDRGVPWSAWLQPDAAGMIHPPPDARLGEAPFSGGALPAKLALKALVGLVLVSILAFGEEVGWRGYMQPRLTGRFGVSRRVAFAATIWALWHIPFALGGLQTVSGISGVMLALVMPLGHFGYGLMLGYLWERVRSIWIVALAHGAGNNWGNFPFRLMEIEGDAVVLLLLRNVVYVLAGLFCLGLLQRSSKVGAAIAI